MVSNNFAAQKKEEKKRKRETENESSENDFSADGKLGRGGR